jgi:hypothetical protein
MSLPSRNIRKTLAPKSIEELATDYILMTDMSALKLGEGTRPRIYSAIDVMGELQLRVGKHRAIKEIARAQETMKMFDV